MANGLALGAIALDHDSSKPNMTKVSQAGHLTQPQSLNKQTLAGVMTAAPELADPAVVRLLVGCQHP